MEAQIPNHWTSREVPQPTLSIHSSDEHSAPQCPDTDARWRPRGSPTPMSHRPPTRPQALGPTSPVPQPLSPSPSSETADPGMETEGRIRPQSAESLQERKVVGVARAGSLSWETVGIHLLVWSQEIPCPLWLVRISGMGGKEKQDPSQAAWGLPEAGEAQTVSSLKRISQLRLGAFSSKKTAK